MKGLSMRRVCLALIHLFMLTGYALPADRPPIIGLSHIGFQVGDLQKSRVFYHELLGYEEPFRLKKEDAALETVYFKINDRQYIELRAGLKPDEADPWVHLAYETTDAEAMRCFLADKGIEVPEKAALDRVGNLSFMVHDFEGLSLEFIQYLPGSLLMRTQGKALTARRISERMLHAGIPVTDIAEASRFYCDILGFSEMLRSHTDRTPNWINYKVPEAGVYIEWMMMDKSTDSRKKSFRYHMGLSVFDVQMAIETLRDRAKSMGQSVEGYPSVGFNNRWQVKASDPDGRRHELMEPYTMR